MSILFWIVTALVAFAFFTSGMMKLTQQKEKMSTQMKWVEDFDQNTIRGIGALEVLGAIGLILPRVTDVLPWLSTLGAAGLILTMIGGATVHMRRKESIAPNILFGLLRAVALLGSIALTRTSKEFHMTNTVSKNNGLNIALWIVQVLLFAAFIISGFMILTLPIAQLSSTLPWTPEVPEMLVRFIGLAEAAGALGLLLPSITKIQPQLTPLAAIGLVIVMLLAVAFHIARGEIAMIMPSLILGLLNAFVAWGRRQVPILARA
jgi:putative oxidoreductase